MSTTTNNPQQCEEALAGLKFVDDPEIGLNVVDLGLIYDIQFLDNEKKVICTMTLTTEFCPMGESIVGNVRLSLESTFRGYTAQVDLVFEPHWDYQMISEEGRIFLNG